MKLVLLGISIKNIGGLIKNDTVVRGPFLGSSCIGFLGEAFQDNGLRCGVSVYFIR